MNKRVLGMGNAVLDILAETEDEYLIKNKLQRDQWFWLNKKFQIILLQGLLLKKKIQGFIANSMVGISILGGNASFCGKVKNDELGLHFEKNMENAGTQFLCKMSQTGLPTARCLVLVTPDGERTMQTFLGASTTLSEVDIEEEFFNGVKFLFVEGYLWSSQSAQNAIRKAVELSKEKTLKSFFHYLTQG